MSFEGRGLALRRRQRRPVLSIDYHVLVERHAYSVPFQLLREQVEVRTTTTVEVFFKGDLTEVIEDRAERASTLIASQLPVTDWHNHAPKTRTPETA